MVFERQKKPAQKRLLKITDEQVNKQFKMTQFEGYYVDKTGNVIKKVGQEFYRVETTKLKNGGYKIAIPINEVDKKGKQKSATIQLHDLIYRTYKGDYEGQLQFLDGDRGNCTLDNIISVKELIEAYNKNNK